MYEYDFKMEVLYLFPEIIVVSLVSFFKYTYNQVHTYIFTHVHKRLGLCHSFQSNLDLYSQYKWCYLVVLSSSWHQSRHISQNF